MSVIGDHTQNPRLTINVAANPRQITDTEDPAAVSEKRSECLGRTSLLSLPSHPADKLMGNKFSETEVMFQEGGSKRWNDCFQL